MNQGNLEEAKRTFLVCAEIPDENLKDPHTHKSSVTSCLYNLGKLLHEQGQQEVSEGHLLQFRNLPRQQLGCIWPQEGAHLLSVGPTDLLICG